MGPRKRLLVRRLRPEAPLCPGHDLRGAGDHFVHRELGVALIAAEYGPDVSSARLVLVIDRRALGCGPAIAPFRESDDHGLHVEPLLREVVLAVAGWRRRH